ncbi:MAG TPA: hypothetical protein VJA66_08690, partial [Thermoanaerobaculia bacterium]
MKPPERSRARQLRGAAQLCGAAALAIGLLVLAGWALDVESLKSVAPGFPPMKPITALAFTLCGVAIVARSVRGRVSAVIASACAS